MESTEGLGTVQPDGTIVSKGGSQPWMCNECDGTRSWNPEFYRGQDTVEEEPCGNDGCMGYLVPPAKGCPPQSGMILPADSAARKDIPITTGVLDYFPLSIAGIARISKKGNDKHNPGEPLHWSRDKSTDHVDCIPRHLVDRDALDPDSGEPHYLSMCWRALAYAQVMEEKRLGLGPSRGSK